MSEKFNLEIITPDNSILKSEASEVIIPSYEGEMGILKEHISIITFLRPGIITIHNEGVKKFYVEEGTVEFSNNCLLILTSTIENLENLESSFIDDKIKDAYENMKNNEINDKEKYLLSYKISTLKEIRK